MATTRNDIKVSTRPGFEQMTICAGVVYVTQKQSLSAVCSKILD
jgi:hypothetical protein